MSFIVDFWSRLDSSVHPDDASVFARYGSNHGFNLDYPPPAYWGDVTNAPILILDNNGGYNFRETPNEYPDDASWCWHLEFLANPRPLPLGQLPPYYRTLNFSEWLQNGYAALVNGVAYRSVSGNKQNVSRISNELESRKIHRKWLFEEVLPDAKNGDRLVIVHRWTRWGLKRQEILGDFIVWSPAPRNKNLTSMEIDACNQFLRISE